MGEVEVDSGAVVRHSENLRGVLRRLIRDKNLSVSRAREATDHSRLLQERLCDLDSSTRSLKQLLKAQQKYEVRIKQKLAASRREQGLTDDNFEFESNLPPSWEVLRGFVEKIGNYKLINISAHLRSFLTWFVHLLYCLFIYCTFRERPATLTTNGSHCSVG